MNDSSSLRNLIGIILFAEGPLPVDPEGRIDVFEVLLSELDDPDLVVELCRSKRFDVGPTIEQIRAGDYGDFPYAVGWPEGPATRPILWDRRAWSSSDGKRRLVGFANEKVKQLSEEEFAKLNLASRQESPD